MLTQQDIYAAGSESRRPMLNKENYVPWSSRLLRYAKSRPNRKLIHNSILNGPYVKKMIPEPGDANREIITKDLHTANYTQLYDFLKYNQKEVDELKAKRLAKTQDPLALMTNSNNPYAFPAPHQDQSSFNQNYLQQPMPNPEDITDPTTTMNMALALMAKAFKLNYSTPTNYNQRISSNSRNKQIAQPGQNVGYNDVIGNQVIQNAVQNPRVQYVGPRLVEAARTMLILSRAPLFLWAEAIATACFTQNRSIINRRFNKTPYELINGRKPDISFLHVFDALCYPKNDREDIGKLGAKGDIGFFIGYSTDSCAYRIYNRRTKKIMETMNVSFDELSATAFKQRSSKPGLQIRQTSTTSTTIVDTTPTLTNSSSLVTNILITSKDVDELNSNAMVDGNTFFNPFANSSTSAAASSSPQNVDPLNMHTFYQPYPHEFQWTKDHSQEQVIGEPSRPVLTRNQL
nr:retrovirus-related Pol polyprotein from transposon TNT 1-94 [Tanacetum cinerariifolium]